MNWRRIPGWVRLTAFWWSLGLVAGLQIWISMLSHHHVLALLLAYQVVVWSVWIGYTLAIERLLRRLPVVPPRPGPILGHLAIAAVFGIAHVAFWIAVELVMKPYDFMNPTSFEPRFSDVLLGQLPLEIILYGVVVLAYGVRDSNRRLREREIEAVQLEASLAQARLHALELQIQPHFLFNTLNAIGALVRTNRQAEAVGMIAGLSELLRYALERAGRAVTALEDEAAIVERYLEIQKLRFPDRLSYDVTIEPGVRRAEVPVLLLQPLAENAIRHGIETSESPGRVDVRALRENGRLVVEVWNTGRLAAAPARGIGLTNLTARLARLYGKGADLDIANARDGVLVRITVPWSEVP